jgi:hypothetical protein
MTRTEPFFLEPGKGDLSLIETARLRSLKQHRGMMWVMLAIGGLLIAPVIWAVWEWATWIRLQRSGVEATACVTALDEGFGSEAETYYTVYFEIEVEGKRVPRSAQSEGVDRSYYERLKVGSTIPVRFFAEKPENARLVDNGHSLRKATGISIICTIPALFFLGFAVYFRRKVRLARDGQLLSGKLLTCSGELDAENDYNVHATYHFVSPTGCVIEGKMTACCNSLKDRPLPEPGTPIMVLYLSDGNYQLLTSSPVPP